MPVELAEEEEPADAWDADVHGGAAARLHDGVDLLLGRDDLERMGDGADVLDRQLPPGMSFEWTELAYQEKLAGNTMLFIFPLCVLLVYIVLAALSESWTLPLGVILIVEFAKQREEEGASPLDAVLEACRIRLRPILMTSLAFIMGVLPLVFSSGAGFEIRQAMGIAVFAGMLGVTLFGLFLTPVFHLVFARLTGRLSSAVRHPRIDLTAPAEGH